MGIEWFNHHLGGFREGAVPTDIHTNTDTTCKERTKERRVTTTRGVQGRGGTPLTGRRSLITNQIKWGWCHFAAAAV